VRRNLAFGRPAEDPDHEAAMRFGGKAPRQRPILLGGMKAMVHRGLSYLGSWPAICSKAVAEGIVSRVIETPDGSHRGPQCDALRQLACCDEPPKRDQ